VVRSTRISGLVLLAACLAGGAAVAQSGAAPKRLDEGGFTPTQVLNGADPAVLGTNCRLLRVQPGESFQLTASPSDDARIALEVVEGQGCDFSAAASRRRFSSAADERGQMPSLILSTPGMWSVRVTSMWGKTGDRAALLAVRQGG